MENRNPAAALDAMVSPSPMPLGRIAILERMGSPVLRGDCTSLLATGAALWVLELPTKEAALRWPEAEAAAPEWLDGLSPGEYRAKLEAALGAIRAFYSLLPRADAEESKKNDSATDGSPSSPSGTAAPTP